MRLVAMRISTLLTPLVRGPGVGAALALIATGSCGPARSHPAESALERSSADETLQSAEWLYVTGSGQPTQGPKPECDKVAEWVVGEKGCTGELCTHARDLGREWLRRCADLLAARKGGVKQLVDEASRRAELPTDDCIQQGNDLQRTNECGKPEACVAKTQRWIASCGEHYATPLMVLMLTRTCERRFAEPTTVAFDKRSCATLTDQIRAGVGCDGEQNCKTAAESVTAFNERCAQAAVPLLAAMSMADVLVGADRSVDPIAVQDAPDDLADGDFPLLLGDHKGFAAWVCGERPRDLGAYVAVRQKCSPGEVIFVRVRSSRQVHAVSVRHGSDAEFSRLYPFLLLRGEREARDRADLGPWQQKLREAANASKAGRTGQAIAMLAAAMLPRAALVSRRADHQKALSKLDADLVPALREWGRLKFRAANKLRDPVQAALFAGRALTSPLSDMRADGTVLPGAYAAPSSLSLAQWMPEAFAAYRKELTSLNKSLKVNPDQLTRLTEGISAQITACAVAMGAVSQAERTAEKCLLEDASCSGSQAQSLSAAADPQREEANAALRAIGLVLTSGLVTRAEVDRIDAQRVSAGCIE